MLISDRLPDRTCQAKALAPLPPLVYSNSNAQMASFVFTDKLGISIIVSHHYLKASADFDIEENTTTLRLQGRAELRSVLFPLNTAIKHIEINRNNS